MQNPLNKRFKRDLKFDAGKYIAIFLFIVFFIGAASGFLVADNSVLAMFDDVATKYNIEDGHISFNVQPDKSMLSEIEKQNDLKLFELNYKEEDINNLGKTLRIYKQRQEVNTVCLMSGKMPSAKNQVALDRTFAKNNNINVGDKVSISGKKYLVCGMVALPDYSALFKSNADMMFDAVGFGVAIMTDGGYDTVSSAHETVNYAWKYNKAAIDESDENTKSESLMKSLEKIIKKYDEPIVQNQVDALYDDAKPYIKRLKSEFEIAEKELESKYFTAIRNAGIGNDSKTAKELGITTKQYTNLKNVLEDAEKNQDDWDVDSFDTAPKINLDDYNVNILNAGVYDNDLYIIPLFYGVDVLVSTEERLKNFDIKENNGFSLTYSNFSDVFKNYFSNDEGYSFVSNELSDFLWFDYPMQLFCRFLNSYVDFENKAVYFDTDEFKDNLDVMMQMLTISQKNNTNELFDGLYINRSFPLMAGNYSYYQSINETPVVFRGLTKNKDVNSAHIQAGYAINNNTQLKEQALAFIKYTLSDEIQEIGATASGSLSFPVNISVYDNAKLVAGSRTDDNNKIIGIDNDFMKAYIDIADNVNACTLYRDVSHSYYNDNVIGEIVDNYINKGISKDKFIRQLSAATEIYLTE